MKPLERKIPRLERSGGRGGFMGRVRYEYMDTITFSRSEEETFRQLGVTGVILFGSHARGIAGEASDFDIGVLCSPSAREASQEKALYEGLYDMLSAKIGKLVNIDIVFLDGAPLELAHHAAKYGKALYEQPAGSFARFKEMVMIQYADFAPYRRMFHEQLLKRLAQTPS